MTELKPGDSAPDILAPSQDGRNFSLKELQGKKNVVLYFYPKDDTPGCTKEACGFRDLHDNIARLEAEIVGVSLDGVESHRKFSRKFQLPFTLVSDEDKKIAKSYGVLGLGGFTARRVTFIIDKQGIIRHVFPKVDASAHPSEVLALLEKM